ncbi:hypothetical protein, partial [Bariatricus sp. HCP28S3_A11]
LSTAEKNIQRESEAESSLALRRKTFSERAKRIELSTAEKNIQRESEANRAYQTQTNKEEKKYEYFIIMD